MLKLLHENLVISAKYCFLSICFYVYSVYYVYYIYYVLFITGDLGKAPAAVNDSLPVPEGATAAPEVEEAPEEEDMQARLEALRT